MPLDGLQVRHYLLLKLIGSGGMGEIYLARDQRLDRQVAVKVVRSDLVLENDEEQSAKFYRLFQREARTISMLDHPHILPLFDYGEVSHNEARLTYLVMPYHPEGSLDIWLRKSGKTTPFLYWLLPRSFVRLPTRYNTRMNGISFTRM
ncbi:protein kinase domain-containing protein [Ktedonospora formicarum]|uniref:Protein kinase domain-containing protein n=1 Tax=Ktedonospora formicarum TaxID=2778364 RepID=A0A8J3MVZ0_9CHLR|nr:protein kinase [Ktedonospora formicarum]GHO48148.1 hypothetical protein KSX_63110 [Ktedonospora formicarum]